MDHSVLFVSSMLFWALPAERWFSIAAAEDLGGVEVWAQQLDSQGIKPETVRALSVYYGIPVTVHSYSWDVNPSSLCREMKDAAVKLTKRAIAMAAFFEAPQITIHPGRETLPIPGVDYDRLLAESASELGRFARERETAASFEIMEKIPKERLTSPEAVARMESAVDGDVCWKYTEDIAHCDSIDEIFRTASLLAEKISEFHVSNKRGAMRHIPDPEAGDFDLPSVINGLSGYGKPFILEGFDPSRKADVLYRTLSYLDGRTHGKGMGAL